MLVKNKTVRLICFGNKQKLIPGMNDLSGLKPHELKALMPMLKEHEEKGNIEMPEMDIDDDFAEGVLEALSAADAVKLIKETYDHDTLLEMQEEEKGGKERATVLKALANQIKLNEDALKNSKE